MKFDLKKGEQRNHSFKVLEEHFPNLGGKVVHPVCSTYVLAREIEWSTRKFMLDVIEDDEEGIGTMLEIKHQSPAYIDEQVDIVAVFESIENGHLICEFVVRVGERTIAEGRTGQKLLKKSALDKLYNKEKL